MTDNTTSVPRDCGHAACKSLGEPHPFCKFVSALDAAPSPAGVDGLEIRAYEHVLNMELGQKECFFSEIEELPFGVKGEDFSATYDVTSKPLCRLSDAQAIIDGLLGELRSLEEYAAGRMNKNHDLRQQLNRQAQRIGELEGLLRDCYPGCGLTARQTQSIRERIDAALSAGKEGE